MRLGGRIALLWSLAGPPGLWALHFIAVYATISAACAPRALVEPATAFGALLAVTLLAIAAALVTVFRPPGHLPEDFRDATKYIAVIAAAAILFNLVPFFFTNGCGG